MARVLAVDLGGTKTAIAIVDDHGTMRDRRTLPAAHSLEESISQIASVSASVDAVGMIVPGIYTPETGYAWCPNLWGPDDVPLLHVLQERLHANVHIDCDRAGYVLGEAWLGAGRGFRHVIFVSIGTGIGVGILADGFVLRGAHGIAGAAGWFALDPQWKDEYRAVGCWEAESAGPGVAQAAGMANAEAVVEAARAGDATARRVLERASKYTAMGIANLISVLNPEVVVVGGGLAIGAHDLMLDVIRFEVRRWAQPIAATKCHIELTKLGDEAGLLGAAYLALRKDV